MRLRTGNAAPKCLIVLSGLPGTGKSEIASRASGALGIPILAKDVIEAALWRGGVGREQNSGWIAYELLTALAEALLEAGSSVILDSVCASTTLREQWHELARRRAAALLIVECVCSDETAHRGRLARRKRDIPGWYELTWEDLEKVRATYVPWSEERLVLDAATPLEENVAEMLSYLGGMAFR